MMTLWCSCDPVAGGELADDGLVEFAPGRVVDRLETGLGELELGLLQGAGQALVLAGVPLGLDEQREALVEGEGGHVGLLLLGGPGRGHGAELEGVELFEGGGVEHHGPPSRRGWGAAFAPTRPARGARGARRGAARPDWFAGARAPDTATGAPGTRGRSRPPAPPRARHTARRPRRAPGSCGPPPSRAAVARCGRERVLVVRRPAQVFVGGARERGRGRRQPEVIEPVFEDGVDMPVGARADGDGAGARGLQPGGGRSV